MAFQKSPSDDAIRACWRRRRPWRSRLFAESRARQSSHRRAVAIPRASGDSCQSRTPIHPGETCYASLRDIPNG